MTTVHYSKYDVLAMFREANPSKSNPTQAQVQAFEADLFRDNEATLVQIMTEEGLPNKTGVKSTILLYSRHGSGTLNQRVRKACTFFKNTDPL